MLKSIYIIKTVSCSENIKKLKFLIYTLLKKNIYYTNNKTAKELNLYGDKTENLFFFFLK